MANDLHYNGLDSTQNFFNDDLTSRSTSRVVGSAVAKSVSLDEISPTIGDFNIDQYYPAMAMNPAGVDPMMSTIESVSLTGVDGWTGNLTYGYSADIGSQGEQTLIDLKYQSNTNSFNETGMQPFYGPTPTPNTNDFKGFPEPFDIKPALHLVPSPRGGGRRSSRPAYEIDPAHAEHRRKNNEAVRKSRAKAKQREEQAKERAAMLQKQMDQLKDRIHDLEYKLDMEQRKNTHLEAMVQQMMQEQQIQPIQVNDFLTI